MQSEKEYVINIFNENFAKYKDKKIILYGTGPNTKLILENVTGFNFVGLMDGYKKSGSMYGLELYDYDDVEKLNIDMIIIIARKSATKIIYNRISNFCVNNKISLFDIYGEDLLNEKSFEIKYEPYFSKNEDELKKLIIKNDVISFDIFDTLIMRKTLFPEDVFELMGEKLNNSEFKKLRKEYEIGDNLSIFEIYDKYQQKINISDDEKNRLINLEIEMENRVLCPRDKVVEIFNYAKNNGKKVFLISDMYLPGNIIEGILKKFNIYGYEDIFISCEYKTSKSQGLYKIYKEKVKAFSYLHIGDNSEADGIFAELNGISSYIIKSSYDMAEVSMYRELLSDVKTLQDRVVLGMFLEKAFNNPFILHDTNGRLPVKNAYNRGYLFIAPIITSFVLWFINKIKEKDFSKVIFLARDGFLISKLYEIFLRGSSERFPESIYFLTSRVAAVASSIYNYDDIKYASDYSFGGLPDDMLQKRFLLPKEDIEKYEDGEELDTYIKRHELKIYENSVQLRKNYLKYIENFGIKNTDALAFFDFVSSGTCQMCLNRILNMEAEGFYFIKMDSDYERKRMLKIKSLIKNDNAYKIESYVYDNYLFLEYIVTSFDPSLGYFNDKGEPIFLEETRSSEFLEYLKIIHNSIIDYFEVFLNITDKVCDVKIPDKIFGFMQNKYTDLVDNMPENLVFRDEFCDREMSVKELKI